MSTIAQLIRDGIIARLNESGAPTEFTKRRWNPTNDIEPGTAHAAVLFHRESPELAFGLRSPITRRDHSFAVQYVTATREPDDIDDALELGRIWIVEKLGGYTVDGIAHELVEGETTWETVQRDWIHGAITVLWRAQHQTKTNDLQARS